jgi:hypothetical protein
MVIEVGLVLTELLVKQVLGGTLNKMRAIKANFI